MGLTKSLVWGHKASWYLFVQLTCSLAYHLSVCVFFLGSGQLLFSRNLFVLRPLETEGVQLFVGRTFCGSKKGLDALIFICTLDKEVEPLQTACCCLTLSLHMEGGG